MGAAASLLLHLLQLSLPWISKLVTPHRVMLPQRSCVLGPCRPQPLSSDRRWMMSRLVTPKLLSCSALWTHPLLEPWFPPGEYPQAYFVPAERSPEHEFKAEKGNTTCHVSVKCGKVAPQILP